MSDKQSRAVLAFDVYGTLIDPFQMEEHLRADFGENARAASELWRGKQIEYSFRRALMKQYEPFHVCTEQALRFVASQMGMALPPQSLESLMAKYLELPAYPDVVAALAEFASQGFQIVACSNGTERAVRASLESVGLMSRFSKIVSVDALRTFKPDPAVYEYLVAESGAPRDKVWLISSNPFDVIGAKACGLRTAWVQRDPKRIFDPWGIEPDVTVHSLAELPAMLSVP